MSASPTPASLARGVTATWWYTAGSVVLFQLTTLATWMLVLAVDPDGWPFPGAWVLFAAGGVLSAASTLPLLRWYRAEATIDVAAVGTRFPPAVTWALAGSAVGAAALGVAAGSALLGVAMATLALCVLHWTPGVRIRLVIAIVLLLVVLWIVEGAWGGAESALQSLLPHRVFALALAPVTVLSLWWWDIVVELDRARATEGRLAAAQERLRLAADLHDLQGHHLQVIALQLELAERMLARDPSAAAEQVRLARASVDEARRGTRELAGRFRGVPLPDELANAAELLQAAGLHVDLEVAPEATDAPTDVLGPVVRESTTNVLKHGGGSWATLSLVRADGRWRLRVANDLGAPTSALGAGSGLAGIADRVGEVGGELTSGEADGAFTVLVTVPAAALPGPAEATP